MEYCSGGSLRELISLVNLKEEEVAYICMELLQAIDYIHSNNRIHRDIKSSNIVIDVDGSVKLADMVGDKLTPK